MEMWFDIPQQVWKTFFVCWLILLASLICFFIYVFTSQNKIKDVVGSSFIFKDLVFWVFILPFIIVGFVLVLFSGIGILDSIFYHCGYYLC